MTASSSAAGGLRPLRRRHLAGAEHVQHVVPDLAVLLDARDRRCTCRGEVGLVLAVRVPWQWKQWAFRNGSTSRVNVGEDLSPALRHRGIIGECRATRRKT